MIDGGTGITNPNCSSTAKSDNIHEPQLNCEEKEPNDVVGVVPLALLGTARATKTETPGTTATTTILAFTPVLQVKEPAQESEGQHREQQLAAADAEMCHACSPPNSTGHFVAWTAVATAEIAKVKEQIELEEAACATELNRMERGHLRSIEGLKRVAGRQQSKGRELKRGLEK